MASLSKAFHLLTPLGLIAFLSLIIFPVSAIPAGSIPRVSRLVHIRLYPTNLCLNTTTASIPHLWSVQFHSINYSTPGVPNSPGGTASFSVTNSFTNITNKIECGLRFDSLCDVKLGGQGSLGSLGSQENEESGVLDIHLQVLIEVAYVTVVESVTCKNGTGEGDGNGGQDQDTRSVSVGGMAEVYLGCDFEASPRRCWGEEGGWVDGEVLGEAPGGGTGG